MVTFTPRWSCASALDPVSEGDNVSVPLTVADQATVVLPANDSAIDVGASANRVLLIESDAGSIPFTISGSTIVVSPNASPRTIVITRGPACVVSLLRGSPPPGLSVNDQGILTGRVGNIRSLTPITYQFAVRASNGTRVQDLEFTIRATPVVTPPVWQTAGLPNSTPVVGTDDG